MPVGFDYETFSTTDLKKCGMFVYFENPDTEVLCFSYKIDDQPTQLWTPASGPVIESIPELHYRAKHGDTFTGWNAGFEFTATNMAAGQRIHMPKLEIGQMRDTAARAASLALPRAMGKCAEVLNMPIQKDEEGKRVMLKLSKPRKPTKTDKSTRWTPQNAPQDFATLYRYNINDTDTEYGIQQYLGPLSDYEQVIWELDYIINARGVPIDIPMARNIVKMRDEYLNRLAIECRQLCGFDPSQVGEIYNWITNTLGFRIPQTDDYGRLEVRKIESLDKDDVKLALAEIRAGKAVAHGYLLAGPGAVPATYGNPFNAIHRVLEIRQQASQTSTKKYDAMLNMMNSDGRIRGTHLYWGAGPGRWAARGVQFQNVKKSIIGDSLTKQFKEEHKGYNMAVEFADISSKLTLRGVEMLYAKPMDAFSSALRSCVMAPPGYEFVVNDYSSIEARFIAWLAGEEWRLEVFRTHGKIYEASASQMFGIPLEEITKDSPYRQSGKVSELALGFGGGVGALVKMGAIDRYGLKYEELKPLVKSWRAASPAIVKMWRTVYQAVIQAVQTGQVTEAHRCRFGLGGPNNIFFHIQLPSGRMLTYVYPRVRASVKVWDEEKEKFEVYNEQKHPLYPHQRVRWNPEHEDWEQYTHEGFRPQEMTEFLFEGENSVTRQWGVQHAWYGVIIENIVQGGCACLLRNALVKTEQGGFANFMHVHDEDCSIAPIGLRNHKEHASMMCDLPAWAEGLPVKAEGWQGPRYKKD